MRTEVRSPSCEQIFQYKEDYMGVGYGPGKSDNVATIDALAEKEKGIKTISPQQKDVVNKPKPKVKFKLL